MLFVKHCWFHFLILAPEVGGICRNMNHKYSRSYTSNMIYNRTPLTQYLNPYAIKVPNMFPCYP